MSGFNHKSVAILVFCFVATAAGEASPTAPCRSTEFAEQAISPVQIERPINVTGRPVFFLSCLDDDEDSSLSDCPTGLLTEFSCTPACSQATGHRPTGDEHPGRAVPLIQIAPKQDPPAPIA